jgi:NAD(P)-dependent dehydrogenase (short-subunit alcohol dehydrogenase family)
VRCNNIGGARGIGKATVEFFHEHGAILEFADLNDQNGKTLETQLKEYFYCEFTKIDERIMRTVMLRVGNRSWHFLNLSMNDMDILILSLRMLVSLSEGNFSMKSLRQMVN